MSRDDIISLVRDVCDDDVPLWRDGHELSFSELERFAGLVAAAERERMAVELESELWLEAAALVRGTIH